MILGNEIENWKREERLSDGDKLPGGDLNSIEKFNYLFALIPLLRPLLPLINN
jgi:hypothetical protein